MALSQGKRRTTSDTGTRQLSGRAINRTACVTFTRPWISIRCKERGEGGGTRTHDQRIKSPGQAKARGWSAAVHSARALRSSGPVALSGPLCRGSPVRRCPPRPLITWGLPSRLPSDPLPTFRRFRVRLAGRSAFKSSWGCRVGLFIAVPKRAASHALRTWALFLRNVVKRRDWRN
jgi:hypothetical protein